MSSESCAREEMRQARLKMPRRTFAEAWKQHDEAEKACLSFGNASETSSAIGPKHKVASSTKTQR
ncbi:MAG: hypothetical protein ABI162_17965 [Luteolibacter sp.]